MDSRLEQAAGILRRAHQKYTSDLFSLEVEVDEGEEPLLRILRFEDGQIRDIMERRQPIIPDGLSPDDLRYAAFVFGMARAAVELAEQDDYHLWFDDLVSIDLMRLDALVSEDDFFQATLDFGGARLQALAIGAAEKAAQKFNLPVLEVAEDQRDLYLLWDRTATLTDIWDDTRILRSIGNTPKPQLFDYVLAILEESLDYPDGWYPNETFDAGLSGPRIYAAITKDAVRPEMNETQRSRLDAIVDQIGWLPAIERLEALEGKS